MAFKKIGRNEPCPCGSGKKYKVCCQQQTQKPESHATEETTVSTTELFAQGLQHHKLNEVAQAQAFYEQILQIDPAHADALHHLGLILHHGGNNAQALALIQKAIAIQPTFAIYNNVANILKTEGRIAEAIENFHKAIALKPDYAEAYNNLGVLYKDQKNSDHAIAHFQKAIALNPDFAGAYLNLGTALKEGNNLEASVACYQKAIAIQPDYAEAYNGLASSLNKQHKIAEAIATYQKAIALNPKSTETLNNLGNIFSKQKNLSAAIACYEKALALNPQNAEALGGLFHSRQHCCDWTDFDSNQQRVVKAILTGQEGFKPLSFLAVSDSGQAQKQCAFTFAKKNYPAAKPKQAKTYQHSKIRIAYVSGDLREHAVAILMTELFELHDKNRFEVFAISLQPETSSSLGQRVKNAFTQFIDVTDKSDVEVAQLIERLEIDIAVDLMGFTANSRTAIFSYRPAPIQINYLGYPGTMGVDYIDYIVADEYLIPADLQKHYCEKIIYLPDCFQVNDSKRFVPSKTPTRSELGLPATGFVFCAFNGSYKFTPPFFDAWMNILTAVPNSVLWLFADNSMVEENLRREAINRGVAVERLIFSKKVVYQLYLAQYPLADLFLDTLPFNGGTTVSDALWMGLPVLTYSGEAFAARMAGSLLNALGLPELITDNLRDYENKAIQLATTPTLLAEIRAKLAEHKKTYPLFNPSVFCKHLESAYTTTWERHQRGESPVTFKVENFSTPASLLETALNHHHAGQFVEAERLYRQILQIEPNNPDAFHFLGLIAHKVEKENIAKELIRKSIEINPNNYVYYSNLGVILRKQGESEKALEAYQKALSLKQDDTETLYNLGLLLLLLGQFNKGWQYCEYRYHPTRISNAGTVIPNLHFQQWRGESLVNKSIVIWYEQGLGDQIQFCRYAPILKELGAIVVSIVCSKPLKPLFETILEVDYVLAEDETHLLKEHDYWVFPLSIPLHCHTTVETIPCKSSYLSAIPERVVKWKSKIPDAKLIVGLVWKGSTIHPNDANRSLASLQILSPLWDIAEVAFISLQRGKSEDEVLKFPFIASLASEIEDFADSAAIISQLDLVICVDTAIAHLAGALGKPVWLLLPFVPDWRWMINREDTPWYPNTRLFRQSQKGNWNEVVIRVKQALISEVNNKLKNNQSVNPAFSIPELFNTAQQQRNAGNFPQAEAIFQHILTQQPNHAEALHWLGITYYQTGNNLAAAELIKKSIALNPDSSIYYCNFGVVLSAQKQIAAAIAAYQQALRLKPDNSSALYNLGNAYTDVGQFDNAIQSYLQGLSFNPNSITTCLNLGEAYRLSGKLEQAIDCYQQVLAAQPQHIDTLFNLAFALETQGKETQAKVYYEKVLALNPHYAKALDALFSMDHQRCEWTAYDERVKRIIYVTKEAKHHYRPFGFLHVSDNAALQYQGTQTYTQHRYPAAPALWKGDIYQHPKIRLAYLSGDFCDHAVSRLLVSLWEEHDRNRFEVFALSFFPVHNSSALGLRVAAAFDHFIDISNKKDEEVARLIRQLEIDIAIDLTGFTINNRTDIFSFKPAPIQINYLGYPATMGANYIDYIFADPYLIPSEYQQYYAEKIVYLPECFQANDSKRLVPDIKTTRAELGLPEAGFVFCSFNSSYKFTPPFFQVWMNLLKAVPDSVLWLFAGNEIVQNNLQREAVRYGVAPERLIFTKKVSYDAYLANYRLADLFLDTLPFNGGTTVSDALWMELPVLTCSGEAFAARMAGSLLNAIGLPELISQNLLDYQEKAIKLATTPSLLAEVREKLIRNRKTYPLFNAERFRRHIESAYVTMWEKQQRGEAAQSFRVNPVP